MGKLTAKKVLSIVRSNKSGRYGDGDGLYLMVPKSGAPFWMLRYTINKKRKEMTIARVNALSLADARLQAAECKKKVRSGIDPLAERQREQQITIRTVDDLFYDWYADLQKRLKHPNIPKRIYAKDIAPYIGQTMLTAVTPMDIRGVIQKITASGRPTVANDALMYSKQLFNHAIKLDLIQSNPAGAFTVNDAGGVERSRERALSIDELKIAFKVFRDVDSFTRDNYLACALLVVLGVRKGELIGAKWSELNLDNALWQLPVDRSKTTVAITIPLPIQAVEWLKELKVRAFDSEYVFPNRRASKTPHMGRDTLNRAISKLFGREPGREEQLLNVMGDLEYFTVHDLRRTCRSLLAALSVPGHVAERCLNHKIKGVEGIYNKHDYLEERKNALQKLADLVAPIVNGEYD